MLVATISDGTFISLYRKDVKRETLLQLRKEEQFYCPACQREVILKLGEKQAWHFAHKKKETCNDFLEGETPYHIEGKKLLYDWFMSQQLHVELEPYLPQLKQRPDLLVHIGERRFAIEFQCAKIPHQIFMKRTKNYQDHSYIPIWILGGNQIQRIKTNLFQLNSFHWLFTLNPHDQKDHSQLIAFCPENKIFIKLNNILALSANRSICTPTFYPLNKFFFHTIFQTTSVQTQSDTWLSTKRMWRTYRRHLSEAQHFLRSLYLNKGIPYTLFPSEAGVPVPFHEFIETPTYVWQSWILEIFVNQREKHSKFHFKLVKRAFQVLVRKGVFHLRLLPLKKAGSENAALKSYLLLLCELNILLTKDGSDVFIKMNDVKMPKTFDEAIEIDKEVNKTVLLKNRSFFYLVD